MSRKRCGEVITSRLARKFVLLKDYEMEGKSCDSLPWRDF